MSAATHADCPRCGSSKIELDADGALLEHYRPGGEGIVCSTATQPQYGERVDALLSRLGTDLTSADFRALCIACADQAGASPDAQARIEELLP